jgi:soluble lytic murein transglycosylase-like protein
MQMKTEEKFFKFDPLIKKWAEHYGLPWRLIKAQVWQESAFDPCAKSSCGALGLMQLMPETDFWIDKDHDAFDPEGNIENGIRYDKWLWDHFPEIPEPEERLSFMLAAYNGGRGYVNKAIELSYEAEFGEQMPARNKGQVGGWQKWARTSVFLYSSIVNGKTPDANQIIDYVEKIWLKYRQLWEVEK